jgi:hypothetical protein
VALVHGVISVYDQRVSVGDTKDGREEVKRGIERAPREELARSHETEPPRELDDALEELECPAPAERVVGTAGEYEVQTDDDAIPVAEVVERSSCGRYESADDARMKLRRPSVAASLRRLEAVSQETGLREEFRERRDACERTPRARGRRGRRRGRGHRRRDGVGRRGDAGQRGGPKLRRARKRAAKFCRNNGYEVREDDWLGA